MFKHSIVGWEFVLDFCMLTKCRDTQMITFLDTVQKLRFQFPRDLSFLAVTGRILPFKSGMKTLATRNFPNQSWWNLISAPTTIETFFFGFLELAAEPSGLGFGLLILWLCQRLFLPAEVRLIIGLVIHILGSSSTRHRLGKTVGLKKIMTWGYFGKTLGKKHLTSKSQNPWKTTGSTEILSRSNRSF